MLEPTKNTQTERPILERLLCYNPPDRTVNEQRQIAKDIHDAAKEIERLQNLVDIGAYQLLTTFSRGLLKATETLAQEAKTQSPTQAEASLLSVITLSLIGQALEKTLAEYRTKSNEPSS